MFSKVLEKIKPNKKEEQEVKNKVDLFLKKINSKLLNAEAIVGGSFAKGTWLKNQHDIDIFVLFTTPQNISTRLEVAIKATFDNMEKIHGSRDYFLVNYENLNFELVPVLKINSSEKAENITDISPMHVDYIKKNINEKLADEIRLTKYLMKMNKCYGAETYIGGFSGYLIELLVIYYKGFNNLIKSTVNWKHGEIINLENENNFISEQKFPLIVIDPVQANRNVSAALRDDKFHLFINLAKKFNSKLSVKFFKEIKINPSKYNLVFRIEPVKGSKDVSGTKMLKAFEKINSELNLNEFKVINSDWEWTDFGYFYFKIKNKTLSKTVKHYGPPVRFEQDAEKFKLAHKNLKIKEEKERLYVNLPRKFTNIKDFIKSLSTNKEISDKVYSMAQIK